jgi:hypothetical protein
VSIDVISAKKKFFDWMRDTHLYAGLFFGPLILIFAVSTLLLNHPGTYARSGLPTAVVLATNVAIEVPPGAGTLEQAKQIIRQLDLSGEIDFIQHNPQAQRLVIPINKPGELTRVEVDLRAHTATVKRQALGLAEALIYLHKMPGPHLVKLRGNWIYTVVWARGVDGTVAAMILLSITGIYLWWRLKAGRKVGLWLLIAGLVSVLTLLVGMMLPLLGHLI